MKMPALPHPRSAPAALGLAFLFLASTPAEETESLPLQLVETFSHGASQWEVTDPAAWRLSTAGPGSGNPTYELIKKNSDYKPPFRSPLNIALHRSLSLGDFDFQAKVKTTHENYPHRDLCFFFGYQDPSRFYYVHLGQRTDDHANQIFIVDGAPRTKISTKTTAGTPWKDAHWHTVKIVRRVKSGLIQVFFDDMERPVMEAVDKRFGWGRFGFGSFDDTGMWDDIELRGIPASEENNDS